MTNKKLGMLESATDDELVELGMSLEHGAGATVEAMRRLRVAMENANTSSERYARGLLWLTVVLVVLTIVLAIPVVKDLFH